MAIPLKYQAKEVLNKVLNAGEDALNVDLADSVTVTVDSEFPAAAAITDNFANPTTTSAMSMLMGYDGSTWDRVTIGGGTEAAALRVTIANDSTGVVSVDDNGSTLTVDVASGGVASGAIASGAVASGALASGSVADGAMVTLGAKADNKSTATDTTAITAMQVLKQISASVQETATDTGTIDSDTNDIKTAVEIIDNAISGSEMQVDIVADGAGLATDANLALMLYGTALVVTAVHAGSDHVLGATYEAFYIGVGGDVSLDCVTSGTNIVFKNLASGQMLPVRATVVNATNTTATNIVALKA